MPKPSLEKPQEDEDSSVAKVIQKTKEKEKEKESSQRSEAGGSSLRPERSGNLPTNLQPKAQSRTPCPYGTSCYRY